MLGGGRGSSRQVRERPGLSWSSNRPRLGDMMIDWGVPRGGERRAARSFEAVQPGLAAVPSREQAAPWRISMGGQDAYLAWVTAGPAGAAGQAGGARAYSPRARRRW